MIEIEVASDAFAAGVQLLLSAMPLPAPTFEVLGRDRLISSLEWAPVTIAPADPGFAPPPGVALAQAEVKIGHASIAEFETAPVLSYTVATAWLFVGVSALVGTAQRLTIDIVRIDIPGRPTTSTFSPPLQLARLKTLLDLPAFPLSVVVVAQGLFVADGVCTVRLATSADDNLSAPLANRVSALQETWVIYVSGDVFAEQVRVQLEQALAKLPADIVPEHSPVAAWTSIPLGGDWGVLGGFGVKKVNACSGPLGSPDLSVAISAEFLVSTDITDVDPNKQNTMTFTVRIGSSASDWDSLRCWLASGLGPLFAVLLPTLGFESLVGAGNQAKMGAGDEVAANPPEGAWVQVAGDDTSATYQMILPLPAVGPTITDASVGADGLIVAGRVSPLPATQIVDPAGTDGGALTGAWVGGFSCQHNRWQQTFELPYIEITDVAKLPGVTFARIPVTIFPTSTALPADQWSVEIVPDTPNQLARVICHASVSDEQPSVPSKVKRPVVIGASTGHAFIHSSAGLKRYELGPITQALASPDEIELGVMRVNCRNFGRAWTDPRIIASWLVDPPDIAYGYPPLRQWQLTISEVPGGQTFVIHGYRDGEVTERLATVVAPATAPIAIEVVTDAQTELAIDHTLREAPGGARLMQRWLLPTQVAEFQGQATALTVQADQVHVLSPERLVTVSNQADPAATAVPQSAPPYSVTLASGKVAAVFGNSVVIAFPMGGAAARVTSSGTS